MCYIFPDSDSHEGNEGGRGGKEKKWKEDNSGWRECVCERISREMVRGRIGGFPVKKGGSVGGRNVHMDKEG